MNRQSLLINNVHIQIQVRWLDVLELIFRVPFIRLAIHLSTGFYVNASESLFKNERWLRDIGAMWLVGFYTSLWSLWLIIPGIIKGYSYSMVTYLLADDDSISTSEAFALSQEMTDGYKWELFILSPSFLLWNVASSLTFGLVAFYYIPYKEATWTQYYLTLSEKN